MPSQLNSSKSIVAPQDIVESALRHKLEQAIEKMIFSSPGEIDSNLEFYLNLAREHGFTDLARDIEQYTAETLIEFLKEKKKKRTRSAREEHLEDFLMKGNNLELVEPGLTALDRQVTLPSGGILDILARDVGGNETVVELKAEKYRSPSVFEQLRGYLAETGNRTLLVAPKVNPDLFYSLIDQYDQGSLDFHLANPVTEGEEYVIKPFNPESIPKEKRKPIDWAKANKRKKSNGKVRLFGSGREGKVVMEDNDQNINPSSKSENTNKMTPSELRDLPLRYQIMELYGINSDKTQRLSEPIFVTESQKRKLEELLNSERLGKEIELGEKRKSLFDKLREIEFLDGNGHINMIDFGEENVNINLLKKTQGRQSRLAKEWQRFNSEASMYASFSENTNPLEYFKGVEEFRKTEEHYRANGQIHSLATNSEPKSLEERSKEVKRIYEEVESKLNKFEKSSDFGKTCAVLKNELPRFDDISMILRSPYIQSDIELQKIKLGMVTELTSIDETLARIVFDYTPLTHSYLSKLNSFESEVKTFNEETNSYSHISMLHHFTEGFQSLCTEIMGSLKVVPTYAALIQQRNLAPETETKYLSAIEVTREQKQSLEALVRNKLLSDLQERAQFKRVSGEIVEEIASNGIDLPANEKALWHKSDLILEKKKKELKPLLEPIENYMNQDFSTFSIDRLEQIIQNAEREVNRVAGANKEHVQRYNEGMRVMARSKLSGSRAGDDLAKGLKVFNGIRSTLTGLKTETNRIRGLMEVDRTLGLAYMCYTFDTHFDMEGGYEEDNESNRENGLRYHQGDQRFYEEILENLVVKEELNDSSLSGKSSTKPANDLDSLRSDNSLYIEAMIESTAQIPSTSIEFVEYGIDLTNEQAESLRSLSGSKAYQTVMDKINRANELRTEDNETPEGLILKIMENWDEEGRTIVMRGGVTAMEYREEYKDVLSNYFPFLEGESIEEDSNRLRSAAKEARDLCRKINEKQDIRNSSRVIEFKIRGELDPRRLYLFDQTLPQELDELANLLEKKSERAVALSKVNKDLARGYLYSSPCVDLEGNLHPDAVTDGFPVGFLKGDLESMDHIKDHVLGDQKLFDSILAGLNVVPLHYRIMRLHNIAPESREDYLVTTEVSARQKKRLDSLVKIEELDRALGKYDQDFDTNPDPDPGIIQRAGGLARFRKDSLIVEASVPPTSTFIHEQAADTGDLFRYLSGYFESHPNATEFSNIRAKFQRARQNLRRGDDPQMKRIREGVVTIKKLANATKDQDLIEYVNKSHDFSRTDLLAAWTDAKYVRAEALESIDTNLAQSYLNYSIDTLDCLANGEVTDQRKNPLTVPPDFKLADFIEQDTQYYHSILETLVARPEPKKLEKKKQEPIKDSNLPNGQPQQELPKKQYDQERGIATAIENSHPNYFEEYGPWVSVVSGDIAQAGYSDAQCRQFAANLKSSQLSSHFNPRVERPNNLVLETLTQDLGTQYLATKTVPSPKDIKRLYDQANKEFGDK